MQRICYLEDAKQGHDVPPGFELFGFWGTDIHEGWHSGNPHPVIRKTCEIRHYGYIRSGK